MPRILNCVNSSSREAAVETVARAPRPAAPFATCYDVMGALGTGSGAPVRVCIPKKGRCTGTAVKIVEATSASEHEAAKQELDIWQRLGNHRHVVDLLEVYVESDTYYYIMPLCQYSLSESFKKRGNTFSHGEVLATFQQVFFGLQHCHSLNIVHRDIRAANLLFHFNGVVKVGDFGSARIKPLDGLIGHAGKVPYMSPEMVKNQPYGFETDIWSCGIVIYTFLCGRYPYEAVLPSETAEERKEQTMLSIMTDSPSPNYESIDGQVGISPGVRKFLEALLQREPRNRPDAALSAQLSWSVRAASDNKLCCVFRFDPEIKSEICFEHNDTLTNPSSLEKGYVDQQSPLVSGLPPAPPSISVSPECSSDLISVIPRENSFTEV